MGLENADNGFLQLDHVRVPRENMLSRFAQVQGLDRGWTLCPGRHHFWSSTLYLSLDYNSQRGSGVPQTRADAQLQSSVVLGEALCLPEPQTFL